MARLLLDCDGVIIEFTHHVCAAIAERAPAPDPSSFIQWDFIKHHLTDEQRIACLEILSGQEIWKTQPPVPGAIEAVKRFQKAGHEVHFVTNAWPHVADWQRMRNAWIKHHTGIDAVFVHCAGHKHLYSGAVLVDDKFEHIAAWHEEMVVAEHRPDRAAFLFSYPYNANIAWKTRIGGWDDEAALDNILRIASEYGKPAERYLSDFDRGYHDGRQGNLAVLHGATQRYLDGFISGKNFNSRVLEQP